MRLDRALAQELKTANGNGSREACLAFVKTVKAANTELSCTRAFERFDECLARYGRAAVAVCVAVTLYQRRERLDYWRFDWAQEVLDLWTNRPHSYLSIAYIDDGLHPTRICEYAGSFIDCTTE